MIIIFLHLSSSHLFLECVAADERSYSSEIFDRAYYIMKKRQILDSNQLNLFYQKKAEIARIHASLSAFEKNLGEIPEKYQDAVMGSLMKDPVMLPTSKQIVDRVTIQRHLLNSKTDPFNRTPLTEAELIDQTELKEEIEEFLKEKRRQFREQIIKENQQQMDQIQLQEEQSQLMTTTTEREEKDDDLV